MCGRYKMTAEEREYRRKFGILLDDEEYFDIHGYKKRTEIFPGEWITAINNQRKQEDVWWTIEDCGFDGTPRKVINAKSETIHRVAMFQEAFFKDRILIPATGLFEWQAVPGEKKKKRYEIGFGNEPLFAFAGIARDCVIKDEKRRCGVIITTSPNETFKWIHNSKQRQAVVVREEDYEKWLDPQTSITELRRIMQPLPDSETHYQEADEPLALFS